MTYGRKLLNNSHRKVRYWLAFHELRLETRERFQQRTEVVKKPNGILKKNLSLYDLKEIIWYKSKTPGH